MKRYNSKNPVCEKCSAHEGHWIPWKRRDDHVAHWLALSRFPMFATSQWNLGILCAYHNLAQRTSIGWPWHLTNRVFFLRWMRPLFRVVMWLKTGVW